MKELGEYLKETRENNCVGIEEAAEDLGVSINIIENIENGNTRAFRDMYDLKDRVKDYAKYLGLNPDEVIDEFNDFFFEHTSKIKLSDILEAEEKQKSKPVEGVVSPYTQIKEKKIDEKHLKLIFGAVGCVLFIAIIAFIALSIFLPKENVINKELSISSMEVRNEYS